MSLDLRTGKPVWHLGEYPSSHYPALKEDVVIDVAVIGGGVAGALVAEGLVSRGFSTALFDKGQPGAGSTSANTAILSYEPDLDLGELIKQRGKEAAVRAYTLSRKTLLHFEELIKTLPEPCGFEKRESFYFASNEKGKKLIEEEYELRTKNNIVVEYVGEQEWDSLFPFPAPAALHTQESGVLDPVRLVHALFERAKEKGLVIYGDTNILDYAPEEKGVVLTTKAGNIIRATHVVFATGYETELLLKQKDVRLTSTYAIATKPLETGTPWYGNAVMWETEVPYLYMRTTTDHRIIVGGEDEDFLDTEKRDALLPEKAKLLENRVRKMFPDLKFVVETAWTGTFAESKDSLPYIGTRPDFPHAYFALGYGGSGIIFSMMARNIISDLIEKGSHPDADLFAFDR